MKHISGSLRYWKKLGRGRGSWRTSRWALRDHGIWLLRLMTLIVIYKIYLI